MNIKTWQEREGLPADTQGHTLDHCVTPAMQAEIDELRAALKAQPVQKSRMCLTCRTWREYCKCPVLHLTTATQPVQSPPLTDEQIDALTAAHFRNPILPMFRGFARAIEAALKGKP